MVVVVPLFVIDVRVKLVVVMVMDVVVMVVSRLVTVVIAIFRFLLWWCSAGG